MRWVVLHTPRLALPCCSRRWRFCAGCTGERCDRQRVLIAIQKKKKRVRRLRCHRKEKSSLATVLNPRFPNTKLPPPPPFTCTGQPPCCSETRQPCVPTYSPLSVSSRPLRIESAYSHVCRRQASAVLLTNAMLSSARWLLGPPSEHPGHKHKLA